MMGFEVGVVLRLVLLILRVVVMLRLRVVTVGLIAAVMMMMIVTRVRMFPLLDVAAATVLSGRAAGDIGAVAVGVTFLMMGVAVRLVVLVTTAARRRRLAADGFGMAVRFRLVVPPVSA